MNVKPREAENAGGPAEGGHRNPCSHIYSGSSVAMETISVGFTTLTATGMMSS